MSFVDAINSHGEVQTVPAHWLESFAGQFTPIPPAKPTPPAKADTPKESK
jgi:hypothetical protein